ncbi:MAG: glycosyltransferase family 4 protein [Infirmifilum sp.]
MGRPRLLVFTELYRPEGGGGEVATHLILEFLSRHFDVTVVTGTERPAPELFRFARVIRVPWLRGAKPLVWFRVFLSSRSFRKLIDWADVVYIPSHKLLPMALAVKHLDERKRVVLHLHNYQPIRYTSVYMSRASPSLIEDVRVEYLEHGSLLRALLTGLISWTNVLSTASLHFADHVICVSKAQREIIEKSLGNMPNISVVYNPVPPTTFDKEPSENPSLVYSGGSSYIKGFHILMEALPRIISLQKTSLYITAGRSINEHAYRLLAKINTNRLKVLERLKHEEYLSMHKFLWALLFPSLSEEPLPYAVVEAMVLGTIPIASRVGGVPEIVDGTPAEGFLFRRGDVDDLVYKVEKLTSLSREQLLEISEKLKILTLKRFDNDDIFNKLLKVFS